MLILLVLLVMVMAAARRAEGWRGGVCAGPGRGGGGGGGGGGLSGVGLQEDLAFEAARGLEGASRGELGRVEGYAGAVG